MFSFHKPRVYRSTEGCCICRAKSSSSRFTDSRKYESDSVKCFDLKYPRYGEICNACVLLVKRYKRLPVGSNRHWGHVVDARAGPGTKTLTKSKKHREEASNSQCNSQPNNSGNSSVSASTSRATQNKAKALISEKFSKIFKKNKKVGKAASSVSTVQKREHIKRRSSAGISYNWTQQQQQQSALHETINLADSDNECHQNGHNGQNSQKQTRISHRLRQSAQTSNSALQSSSGRRSQFHLGSKRRRRLPPRKNRAPPLEQVQFFDAMEWEGRKTCCGTMYECAALGGAVLIDLAQFKPCAAHQKQRTTEKADKALPTLSTTMQQKAANILVTPPAVVQLEPVSLPSSNAAGTSSMPLVAGANPTPVLKKHHLFFKRQSECFPHGDANNYNNSNSNGHNNATITSNKTEHPAIITATAATTTATVTMPMPATTILHPSFVPVTSSVASLPRHSMTKVATVAPHIASVNNAVISVSIAPTTTADIVYSSSSSSSSNKPPTFLNKIKSDAGKIVKHSWDKLNTTVRLKPSDLQDMKHVIQPVDKAYILPSGSKSTATYAHYAHGQSALHQQPQQQQHQHPAQQQPLTTATLSAGGSSPVSSSSSSSTKFSDNSSDSGFDENMLDRKSASPLQEDTERKILTRPGNSNVQTMFLASGVQIQGQSQNLILTGNEVAAKMLQNRKQQKAYANAQQQQQQQQQQHQQLQLQHPHQPINQRLCSSTVKIAQIIGTPAGCVPSAKLRAIYNNKNTIQHENGVTTIVPASSVQASNQTAAMNAAMAPSTVTITPAPKKINLVGFAGNNSINMNNIINGSGNNQSNLNTIISSSNGNNCSGISNSVSVSGSGNSISNIGGSALGASNISCSNANAQKIILVKSSVAAKYNINGANVGAAGAGGNHSALNQLSQGVCKN